LSVAERHKLVEECSELGVSSHLSVARLVENSLTLGQP
jgi:hypothetical protein